MPLWLLSLWPRLKPVLPYILGGLAVIAALWGLHHAGYVKGKHYADARSASLQSTIADVRTKTAQAQADDQKHADTVKASQDTITKESNDALESQLADARARAAALSRSLRDQARSGGGGQPSVPATADATQGPDAAGQAPLMAAGDLEACSVNTVLAAGWQDWWAEQTKVER